MRRRRNLKRRASQDDSSAPGSDNIPEEDIEKLLKRYKFDLKETKNVTLGLLKGALENLGLVLDDLKKQEVVESYDMFGGYRYEYLVKNDINVDILLKLYKLDNYMSILERLKSDLKALLPNDKMSNDLAVDLYVYNNPNMSNNIHTKVIMLSFYRNGSLSGSSNTGNDNTNKTVKTKQKNKVELFRIKLYCVVVKFNEGKRRLNLNEFIMERLDEFNGKYLNAANTIVLLKVVMQNYNQSKTKVRFSLDGDEEQERYLETGFNGHVFHMLALNLCVTNNYSPTIKTFVLFKNLVKYLSKLSMERLSLENNKGDGLLGSIYGRYPAANMFGHLELMLPQLRYYCGVFDRILNSNLEANEKLTRLFGRRNRMSNFYESFVTFKSWQHNSIEKGKEVMRTLDYGMKERLYMIHPYYVTRCWRVDEMDLEEKEDYHMILYFAFDNNVQRVVEKGPIYGGSKNEDEKREEEYFKEYWKGMHQLYRYNNVIQYVVFLNQLEDGKQGCEKREEVLEGDGNNMNLVLLKYILENVIKEKRLVWHVSRFNVNYPLITEHHKDVVRSTNEFSDLLRGLEELPLKVLNINPINEVYSYCNVYTNYTVDVSSKHEFDDNRVTLLIKLESNNKWPLDDKEGMKRIRLSLLLTIQKELRNRYRLEANVFKYYLIVRYEGMEYKLVLVPPPDTRRVGVINFDMWNKKKQVEDTDPEENFDQLFRQYKLREMCRNAVMKNVGFIGCIRLAKIYFGKHLMMDVDEFVKMMCLGVYGEENQIRSNSSSVSFSQVLDCLASGSWGTNNSQDDVESQIWSVVEKMREEVKERMKKVSNGFLKRLNRDLLTVKVGGVDNAEWSEELVVPGTNLDYDLVMKLHNLYKTNKGGSLNHKGGLLGSLGRNERTQLMKLLLEALKTHLDGIADVYYYKYKLLNYYDVSHEKSLDVYIKFDKFKFVPRGHFRAQNYPQAVVMVDNHLNHLRRVGRSENNLTSKREMEGGLIMVPNIVLIMKLLSKLGEGILYNIVID